jgi:cytolysin (calcineurin-like family phosphatase)
VVLNWRARVTTELIALTNAPSANCPLNENFLHRLIVKIQSDFGNMTYANSCAAGIVMYFFEFCDIGARSEDDYHPKPGSMIDELNSFKENSND